jgi:hypothetical protein
MEEPRGDRRFLNHLSSNLCVKIPNGPEQSANYRVLKVTVTFYTKCPWLIDHYDDGYPILIQ